jgi:hypothetical protein
MQRQWTKPKCLQSAKQRLHYSSSAFATIDRIQCRQVSVTRVINTESLICDISYFRPILPAAPPIESKADKARQQMQLMSSLLSKMNKLTINRIDELSTQRKSGFLSKQSKYLGR